MTSIRLKHKVTSAIFSVTVAALILLGQPSVAAPTGGVVAAGNAQIGHCANTTTIQQNSNQAIINWQGFSIGSNELVQFQQPSSAAVALNRVVGVDPSIILGSLKANGSVFLTNANGVIFGPGSRVDVGATFVATTLGISNTDFLAKNYHLLQDPSKPITGLVNLGNIKAGVPMLISGFVDNDLRGFIVGKNGAISVGATTEANINKNLTAVDYPANPMPPFPGDFMVKIPTLHGAATDLILALDATGGTPGHYTPDHKYFVSQASGDLVQAGTMSVNIQGSLTPKITLSTQQGGSFISVPTGKTIVGYEKEDGTITYTALTTSATPVETHPLTVDGKTYTFSIYTGTTEWSLPSTKK